MPSVLHTRAGPPSDTMRRFVFDLRREFQTPRTARAANHNASVNYLQP